MEKGEKFSPLIAFAAPLVVVGASVLGLSNYFAKDVKKVEDVPVARVVKDSDSDVKVGVNVEKVPTLKKLVINMKPVLVPKPKHEGLIVIDPGHGYENASRGTFDPGAVAREYREADIVLAQAHRLKGMLEKEGYRVALTREDNKTSTPLRSRLGKAKDLGADLFVSLHCNAFGNPSANGVETFYEGGDKSKALAERVNDSIVRYVGATVKGSSKNRGVKKRNLAVLDSEVPSVLVESGFITNPSDRGYLTDMVMDVERGIAEGIKEYLQVDVK